MLKRKSTEYGKKWDISARLPTTTLLIFLVFIPFSVIADMGVDSGEHIYCGDEQWDASASDKIAPGALDSVDEPADEECFTWEADSSQGEWQECGEGGGGNDVYIEEGDASRVDSSGADVYVDFDNTDFDVGTVGNEANVTINDGGVDHDATTNFEANEHTNWAAGSAGTIHTDNYIEDDDLGVDEPYASGWDSDPNAPEKDDVYDYLHQFDADDDGSFTDESWYTGIPSNLSLMEDGDINTFSELQSWVSDEVLLKAGTLTDTKFCVYDSASGDIICNSEGGGGGGTDTKCIYLRYPTALHDFKSIWRNDTGAAKTVTKLWCESDQTVTCMLQVDDGTPADMDSVDLVCNSGEDTDTSLDGDDEIADGEEVDLDIASVADAPTWVSICFTIE